MNKHLKEVLIHHAYNLLLVFCGLALGYAIWGR